MSEIKDKVKEKLMGAKDKVTDTKDRVSSDTTKGEQTSEYEEGAPGTEAGRKEDPLTSYTEKEPMTPAKIKEHEPTAVKREMAERIVEPSQEATNSEEAKEIARRKGMAKGTAGAAETGSDYEQGAAGTNK
jgi:hypothetical protein